ncbi:BTB/POZ domain-containing protein 9-like isoform X1 [Cloeon dipterum]|uniref:BTB/POZ domain-containing protein 9-like isoform X1 n=1 Tax=Cloeon dipterum TaxID=197152 RepID=UPI00321F93B0
MKTAASCCLRRTWPTENTERRCCKVRCVRLFWMANYDTERGYTRHGITAGGDSGILIKLGMPCIINHMKMILWDKDVRSYCYFIEVSMDTVDWVKVIDHTYCYCRSWQYICTLNQEWSKVHQNRRYSQLTTQWTKVFHVVTFEAVYDSKQFTIEKRMIAPTENVAVQTLSASVIVGVSRSRNALLNGDLRLGLWLHMSPAG